MVHCALRIADTDWVINTDQTHTHTHTHTRLSTAGYLYCCEEKAQCTVLVLQDNCGLAGNLLE